MEQHTKPESCGLCDKGWMPDGDPASRVCGLLGLDAIVEADRLNPECPLIEKPREQPTKAAMQTEIAQLRADKAELLEALRRAREDIVDPNRGPSGSVPALLRIDTALTKARKES